MRRLLLGVSLAALLAWSPAWAQIPVTDSANLVAQAKNLLQEVKTYALQAQQYVAEAQSAVQLTTTAASLIQHPNLGQAMGLMNMAGIDSPLPINPYAVTGLLSGYGGGAGINGLVGKVGLLGSLVTTSYSQDHIYDCTTNSFGCVQQQQTAWANAGAKGTLSKLYADLNNHIPVLGSLRSQLAVSTDPAQRENIIAQLGAEQAWAQNATAQAQIVMAMAETQKRINDAQADEKISSDFHAFTVATPYK